MTKERPITFRAKSKEWFSETIDVSLDRMERAQLFEELLEALDSNDYDAYMKQYHAKYGFDISVDDLDGSPIHHFHISPVKSLYALTSKFKSIQKSAACGSSGKMSPLNPVMHLTSRGAPPDPAVRLSNQYALLPFDSHRDMTFATSASNALPLAFDLLYICASLNV